MIKKEVLIAISLLIGTIIGAGILGIPYLAAKAGLLTAITNLIIVGVAVLIIHLMLGEIALSTKKHYQLTGYTDVYLGSWGKMLMTAGLGLTIYGALIAYTIGEGNVLFSLFNIWNPFKWSILFFTISSIIVLLGIKTTGNAEFLVTTLLLIVVGLIGIMSINKFQLNGTAYFSLSKFFIPYGAILFASTGLVAIPEMKQIIKNKKEIKKAIIIGTLIPFIVYLLFTIIVVGIVGNNFLTLNVNQQIATVALSLFVTKPLAILGNIFAALAMFTSFLTLGLALVQIYDFDYGIKRIWSWIFAMFIPLFFIIKGSENFVKTIGITGAFATGTVVILIVLTHWKASKNPQKKAPYKMPRNLILSGGLLLLFILGMLKFIF